MLIVGGLLIFFALLVYYFAFTSYRDKFRNNLLNRAKNTVSVLVNVKEVDTTLLKKIHQSTFYWTDEEIVVTDTNLRIKYSINVRELTYPVLQSHFTHGEKMFFSIAGKDGVFYRHSYKDRIYYCYVLAYDSARKLYLRELIQVLFWSVIFSLWLSVLFSYLFSRKAIRPISDIIDSVKEINSSSLSRRLDEGDGKDEIEQLAMTFNEMLANLEVSFRNQQEFVSNASHELKTPVSVMIAESDYFLQGEHSEDEHRKHLAEMIGDLKKLGVHLNSLLDLAQMNSGRDIHMTKVRLDEILYEAVHEVKNRYQNRKIITRVKFPENEDDLFIMANPGLLLIAVKNIIDNACKFSEDDVDAELFTEDDKLCITVTDKGIGIPDREIDDIYKPFNRGTNARYKSGFGIGLSLVSKILDLHGAEILVSSIENTGTRFQVFFRREKDEDIDNLVN
jgi:signal transduction histidine kinase